jgi:2-polyprenyl-3-methyl-5-hydroxy-6-metoxy-1,4-benzoquinol methylase
MDKTTKFWDRIADSYAKRPVADEGAYLKKLELTREYFRPDMQVMEFGCGTGSTAISHAPFVKHIHGIDVSPRMLAIAQGKATAAEIENISFECTSIDAYTPPDEGLDAILGLSILHLLDNWQAVIARVNSMLKPGGVFVTSTACIGGVMRLLQPVMAVGSFFGKLPSVQFLKEKDLLAAFTDADFLIEHQWQPKPKQAIFIVAKKPE